MYSNKVRAGKRRTYFFDVRETKGNDFYLTITESKKRFDGDGYERHKIFLYKEDFNRFLEGLEQTIDHVKQNLMPEYDYDEYTRRHQEYEAQRNEAFEQQQQENLDEVANDANNTNSTRENDANQTLSAKLEDLEKTSIVDKNDYDLDVNEDELAW